MFNCYTALPNGELAVRSRFGILLGALAGAYLLPLTQSAKAGEPKPQVLTNFYANGYPKGNLLLGKAGALFGTTSGVYGGDPSQRGGVYELVPPIAGQKLWSKIVLHVFKSRNEGFNPLVGLVADPSGNLYGTAYPGVVFQLSPPPSGQTEWSYSILANPPPAMPAGELYRASDGTLYATAAGSYQNGCFCGSVYSVSPPTKGGQWTYSLLYAFLGGSDGENPESGILADSAGNLYGTTTQGGPANAGTVFELSPPANGQTTWTEKQLYAFQGGADGELPMGNLAWGSNGAIYGTTDHTVFALTPPSNGQGAWVETVLAATSLSDDLETGVLVGASGTLYGTVVGNGRRGGGSVYALHPPSNGGTTWNLHVLYNFKDHGFGPSTPQGGLIEGMSGLLYGTTTGGGIHGDGTVFSIQK